jgi:hypothetical protein
MSPPDRLGLILAASVVALIVAFIALFSVWGLPKDPKEVQRLQRKAEAASQDPVR